MRCDADHAADPFGKNHWVRKGPAWSPAPTRSSTADAAFWNDDILEYSA